MDEMIIEVQNLFRNYFVFTGRQGRRSFWFAYLGILLCSFFVSILSTITGFVFLNPLFTLITFVPVLAASIRRYHDVGKSTALCILFYIINFITTFVGGVILIIAFSISLIDYGAALAWSFAGLGVFFFVVALIAWIWNIVILATKGQKEENQYGPVPSVSIES